MIFQISLTLKAGCLPFHNLLHYYDSIFQKLVLYQKILMYLEDFYELSKNWKVPIWFKRKNKNLRDFQVFDFALYPRSKTRKSRKFCLPRVLALVLIQGLKTSRKWTETKTKRFIYDLEQNQIFSVFSSFRFCPIPKSKSRKSRKVLFYLIIYNFT